MSGTPFGLIVYVKGNDFITKLLPYNFANNLVFTINISVFPNQADSEAGCHIILVTKTKPGMVFIIPGDL